MRSLSTPHPPPASAGGPGIRRTRSHKRFQSDRVFVLVSVDRDSKIWTKLPPRIILANLETILKKRSTRTRTWREAVLILSISFYLLLSNHHAEHNMADKVDQLIEKLEQTAQTIQDDATYFENHPEKRQKLLKAAETLTKTVQQPMEGYLDFLTAMANATIVNLFVKWKVFETIDAAGSISYSDLAEKVGADLALISMFAFCRTAQ